MRNRVFEKGIVPKRDNIEVLLGNAGRTVEEDAVGNMRRARQRGMSDAEKTAAGIMSAMEELEIEQRRPRKRKYYAQNVGLEEDPRHFNRHPTRENEVRVGTIDYMDRRTQQKARNPSERGGGVMRRHGIWDYPTRGRFAGGARESARTRQIQSRMIYERPIPRWGDYRRLARTPGIPEGIRHVFTDYARRDELPAIQYKKR